MKRPSLVVVLIAACSNLDQLEGAAVDAYARARDGGQDAGRPSSVDAGPDAGLDAGDQSTDDGGFDGGTPPVTVIEPALLATQGRIVRLEATSGRVFAIEERDIVGRLALLALVDGRTDSMELDGEAVDLDARHGEAAACVGNRAFSYSDAGWQAVGFSAGSCFSTPVYRNGNGATAIPTYWRLVDAGTLIAVLDQPPNRRRFSELPIDAGFESLTVRPIGATGGRGFLSARLPGQQVVGTIDESGALAFSAIPALSPWSLASSEGQRLIAARTGQAELRVWEPNPPLNLEAAPLIVLTNLARFGLFLHAFATAGERIAVVAEPAGSPPLPVPIEWSTDAGVGRFEVQRAFLIMMTGDRLSVGRLDEQSAPYALAFDETQTPPRLLLSHGTDGGSQVVQIVTPSL